MAAAGDVFAANSLVGFDRLTAKAFLRLIKYAPSRRSSPTLSFAAVSFVPGRRPPNMSYDDATWNEWCEKLEDFKEEHGHCNVPQRVGDRLGRWVNRQRHLYKRGKMTPRREERLEALDFCWYGQEAAWDARFRELVALQETRGDCRVPNRNLPLTEWTAYQRKLHKDGELRPDRLHRLESIGFVWNPTAREAGWNERYAQLREFIAEHGHCKVPDSYRGGLRKWAKRQIQARRDGKMDPRREERLEAIGFRWDVAKDAWNARFRELRALKEDAGQGRCRIPKGNVRLTEWVRCQRKMYEEGTLQRDRIHKLERIGFMWDPSDVYNDKWDGKFRQLVRYKEEHGHCRVSRSHEALGFWTAKQRTYHARGELSHERTGRLERLGFAWDDDGRPPSHAAAAPSDLRDAAPEGAVAGSAIAGKEEAGGDTRES